MAVIRDSNGDILRIEINELTRKTKEVYQDLIKESLTQKNRASISVRGLAAKYQENGMSEADALKKAATLRSDWNNLDKKGMTSKFLDFFKSNKDTIKKTGVITGGATTGVGMGGTGLLAPVAGAGAVTIVATAGTGASIGLGYACYGYLYQYNEAVRIKNDTCEVINRCDNINRNMIAIGSRQRCEAQLARQQLNDAQINIKTYGNWYNGCIKYIPGTTNVSTDISC